ncbi:Bor/Iss family lipoprotein [Candidatus Palauibacter sp.]|uniref:Bor/Iss family lipoprotein n=1 Tax=Candidatus Palauibacter sp. TaxID=3101350 RepID=UPI003D12A747
MSRTATMSRLIATIVAVSLSTGCATHHAVVKTGIDPGLRKVEDKWADSYVGGLVAPDHVEVGERCGEGGVAMVETRISFLNQLVSTLTLGIYSPMEIIVTCGGTEETPADETSAEETSAKETSAEETSAEETSETPKKPSGGSDGG